MGRLKAHDRDLKRRIRVLKVASRILAVILSIATLIPLLMTIARFVNTRNTTYTVDGQTRTAWARNTITAYTYSYAAIIATSLVLYTAVLCGYCCKDGIRSANRVSKIATTWTWSVTAVDIVMLSISVSVYRYGKEPVDGKFRDLWGWTCSSTARDLQEVLTSVDFDYYCAAQVCGVFYSKRRLICADQLSAVELLLYRNRRRDCRSPERNSIDACNQAEEIEEACQACDVAAGK
jgi:hypothetical protein